MNTPKPNFDRLEELLADQALFGLSLDEANELNEMLEGTSIDPELFARIAATASLAYQSKYREELPNDLKQKILNGFVVGKPGSTLPLSEPLSSNLGTSNDISVSPDANRRVMHRREMIAWLVAAASMGGVLVDRLSQLSVFKPQLSLADSRALLQRSEPDVITATFKTTEDPSARGVTGDVIWSNKVQQGFVRVTGLAKNEPFIHQYQIWIFDSKRDERYPVDGGVFDVESANSEAVARIAARLRVEDPRMFALTIEKRGGVVVSNRERLLLVAETAPKTA